MGTTVPEHPVVDPDVSLSALVLVLTSRALPIPRGA
jgi:hypothetical protein